MALSTNYNPCYGIFFYNLSNIYFLLISSFLIKARKEGIGENLVTFSKENSPSLQLLNQKSILPHCLHKWECLWRTQQCKENQKSQNSNVLCSVVDVKQCYCLSYRMWKGISCVVPVLIFLQDSHSILSSLNKGPYSVCLSQHCHSPPQKPAQAPV